jgi:hypothetical protein
MSQSPAELQAKIDELRALRDRMLPMLEVVVEDWMDRTEPGYPVVFDNVEGNGYFGVSLDPGYGLYIMLDRGEILAQINLIGWRNDVRSAANREKFTSLPFQGLRPISNALSDNQLRNLISELLSHWNTQPLVVRVTDS